jgi:hypothetical protein
MKRSLSIQVVRVVSIVLFLASVTRGSPPQSAPCERWELSAPVPKQWDLFGSSVVLGSQDAWIGAARGYRPGEVHWFQRSGLQWLHVQRIKPIEGSDGDYFGSSVAVDGDRMVVGAYADSSLAYFAGSAYVFEKVGGSWVETAKLVAPQVGEGDFFGWSVAVSGDTVVVGVNSTTSPPNAQVAHVFVHNGAGWSHQAKLRGHDMMNGDNFGWAVAIEGQTVMVGAGLDDDLGTSSGSVYVFERTGTTWHEKAKLLASDGQSGARFGWSIALDGDRAVIGNTPSSHPIGAAYVFERINQNWVETAKLETSDVLASYGFGYSLALDGDRVAIGAGGLPSGSVYVFDLVGTTWNETAILRRIEHEGTFGRSISLAAGEVLIGSPYEYAPGFPGSASIYLLDQALATYCTAKPNSLGCLPAIGFFGCPAASVASGFEVFAGDVRNNKPGVLLYGTSGKATIPFSGGTLCVASPVKRTPAVSSGGNPPAYVCNGTYSIDMAAFAAGALGGNPEPALSIPGTVVTCQWWGRDHGASHGTTLSNGLEYTVIP